MLGAIKYNLGNLTRLEGHDTRQTFWFYVLFLMLVQYAIGMLLTMPMMGNIFTQAFNGAREGLSQIEMQQRMMAGMGGYMRASMIGGIVTGIAVSLLLVAAFVRRLHDSNRPGWIAGLALVLSLSSKAWTFAKADEILAISFGATRAGGFEAAMAAQSKMLGASLMGWAGMLIVIVFRRMALHPGAEPLRGWRGSVLNRS